MTEQPRTRRSRRRSAALPLARTAPRPVDLTPAPSERRAGADADPEGELPRGDVIDAERLIDSVIARDR